MALWAAPDAPAVLGDGVRREALRAMLLAWADDELVLGHRHCEWTGVAPDIESDVALSSIAQDELGHARLLYEQAAAEGQTPDRLAFGRPPEAFRNATLVERENGDWASLVVRVWLYDHADAGRLEVLAGSPLGSFAALARTLGREEKYHRLFADAWLERLARAGGDSRGRLQAALDALWDDALALFEPFPGEDALLTAGALVASTAEQAARWTSSVVPRLEALGLWVPPGRGVPVGGGRSGRHTPALAALLDEMTAVSRSDPEARW
jgi:ring-1,2-phenylacetyl-CoA epoxidase subunit PaaC